MIRQLSKIIFLFLLAFSLQYAQEIKSIDINFDNQEVLKLLNREDYNLSGNLDFKLASKDTIVERVFTYLRDNGYFNCKLDSFAVTYSKDSVNVELAVKIDEGSRYHVNNIFLEADTNRSVILSELNEQLKGYPYSKKYFEQTVNEIISEYEDDGFPFTSVSVLSVELFERNDSALVNINAKFERGKKATIDFVRVDGNSKTKDYVIVREMRIADDEIYSEELLDDYIGNLNKLKFFEIVTIPGYYINNENKGVLSVNVKEANTNSFDGIVGYVPPGDNEEDGYFTGFVNIGLRNLFGTGRSFLVKWTREERLSQELELKYLEPWIFGYPINISGSLFQRKQDSTYVKRTLDLNIEYLATRSFSAAFILESETVIPSGDDSTTFTVYNSDKLSTGFGFTYDNTDDFYNPRKGVIFNSTYKFTTKSINGPKQFISDDTQTEQNFQMIELDFEIFYSIFQNHIAAFGVHGREIKGNTFEQSDLYYLGGTNTLRGYKERQFNGNRIMWTNLEYRLALSRKSYTFLFFDSGYYLRNADEANNIEEISNFKTGFGGGINIETGLGVLGISYALGEGDSFSQGKIHFGLINEF